MFQVLSCLVETLLQVEKVAYLQLARMQLPLQHQENPIRGLFLTNQRPVQGADHLRLQRLRRLLRPLRPLRQPVTMV